MFTFGEVKGHMFLYILCKNSEGVTEWSVTPSRLLS